jgi:hypothetical protein
LGARGPASRGAGGGKGRREGAGLEADKLFSEDARRQMRSPAASAGRALSPLCGAIKQRKQASGRTRQRTQQITASARIYFSNFLITTFGFCC